MFTIEKLKGFGCHVEEGLERCMNDEGFYLHLVSSLVPDEKIDQLIEAVNSGDLQKGFEIAHSLKGVYGNLAITPLFNKVAEITELLRNKTETDYSVLLEEIKTLYTQFEELAK